MNARRVRQILPNTHESARAIIIRQVGLMCLLMTIALLATAPVQADQALDDYNLAVQLYRQDRWALASESFRKFLTAYPQHEKVSVARMYLGLTQIKQADYRGARDEFRKFVKDFPQNQNAPQAKYRVAECSYLLNDLTAARNELQTFLKDHPDDELGERAWPYLGDVQLRLNNPAAAAAAFAEAAQRYPQGALMDDAQFGWAKALEAQQQTAAADEKFQALAKGDGPRAAEALFQLASREFDQGHFDAAATKYAELTTRFPASPLVGDAFLNAGFAKFRQNDFEGASQQFVRAAEDPKRELQATYWQGLSLKSLGNYAAAMTLFRTLQPKADKDPLAESILFQQGLCERLAGETSAAQTTLLEVVKRFPAGESADDALHFATEMALDAGELEVVQQRLQQFQQEYPRSGLRLYHELLAGRFELAQAAKLNLAASPAEQVASRYLAASQHFQKVLSDSTLPRTRSQARYYLALTHQLQQQPEEALKVIQPLVDEVLQDSKSDEFAEALILQSESALQLQNFAAAHTAAQNYLDRFPAGRQRARSLSLIAITTAQQGQVPQSLESWNLLLKEFPQTPVAASTTLILAELADGRSDWPTAETLYRKLLELSPAAATQVFGLRGLAWAEFQQRKFPAAAEHFQSLFTAHAEHRLAPEARYYHAESLREQGQLPAAAAAFEGTFKALAPPTPAASGAEQQSPLLYAYRSGLQAARTWRVDGKIEKADAAYSAVLVKFPKPQHLDKLLDEWALLNYEAEQYERADEIFRRLVQEVPDSDLADNARLSLAESDLLANRLEPATTAFEALRTSETADADVRERAHYQLIVLALEQRNWEAVRRLSGEFLPLFPKSASLPYVRYALAEAQLADSKLTSEQLDSVLTELRALQADVPADAIVWEPRLWVLAAEIQFRQKRYDEIAAIVAELKQRLPNNPFIYQAEEVWGRALKQQAKFEEARATLDRVLADERAFRTETAAKSQFLIAETWFLQEKWKEALLAYQKVYASYAFPEWQSAALLQSAKCDEQLGSLKDAISTYDRLISEFPMSTHVAEARQRLMQAKLKAAASR